MNTQLFQPAENARMAARDRVLLYTRGMDIDPEDGLALALESLRRAGPGATPEKAMLALFSLLQEKEHALPMPGANNEPLVSVPPISRVTLLPKDMEPLSFSTAFMQWLRAITSRPKNNKEGRS